MSFRELDTVVLTHDVPAHDLRAGDVGAIVLAHAGAFDVEFVRVAGKTQALVRLGPSDLRAVQDDDVLSVRSAGPGSGLG
jgi:hypothetical protein